MPEPWPCIRGDAVVRLTGQVFTKRMADTIVRHAKKKLEACKKAEAEAAAAAAAAARKKKNKKGKKKPPPPVAAAMAESGTVQLTMGRGGTSRCAARRKRRASCRKR